MIVVVYRFLQIFSTMTSTNALHELINMILDEVNINIDLFHGQAHLDFYPICKNLRNIMSDKQLFKYPFSFFKHVRGDILAIQHYGILILYTKYRIIVNALVELTLNIIYLTNQSSALFV